MDFDIDALYSALDRQRRERGLIWAGVAREINLEIERSAASAAPLSSSTLTGMRSRESLEGDGVLQMLLWLNRTPESFSANTRDELLPKVPSGRIVRFDAAKIYHLLETRRAARSLTWTEVARQIGNTTVSSLTRLADGGRVSFPQIMRVLRWLDRSVASVTRMSAS